MKISEKLKQKAKVGIIGIATVATVIGAAIGISQLPSGEKML